MNHLSQLRGQKIASTMLQYYLTAPLPPLLILHGPDGVGKWSAAEALIRQKMCEVGTGCGTCSACRMLARNDHPDYIRFSEERIAIGEPEDPAPFTVRWLLQTRLCYSPFEASLRFVLIPDASLIQHEAETALLKTLEEPPEHTRFIFLVRSLQELKPTIISRGVTIPFSHLPAAEMQTILGGVSPELLELTGGSLHLYPLLQGELTRALQDKIEEALKHPLSLLELERWILREEKRGFSGHTEEEINSHTALDLFSLLLLQGTRSHDSSLAAAEAIFEFKGDLHRDYPGMTPYFLGRLFHRLMQALFPVPA